MIEIINFDELVDVIFSNYDYGEILKMSDDYVFQESPRYKFVLRNEHFDLFFNYVNHEVFENDNRLKEVIERLSFFKELDTTITLERLIYVLYREKLEMLTDKYRRGDITNSIYIEQLKKIYSGNYNIQRTIDMLS